MKILLVFLSFFCLTWGVENNKTIIPLNRNDIIVFDYVGEDLNVSSQNIDQTQTPQIQGVFKRIVRIKAKALTKEQALNKAFNQALLMQDTNQSFDFSSSQNFENNSKLLKELSKGRIDAYRIDFISQNKPYEVEVSFFKHLFDLNSKPSIIIQNLDDSEQSENLNQTLENVFSQSENFKVLEQNAKESDMLLEFKIASAQKAKSNKISYDDKIELNVNYKLILNSNKEILYANTLTKSINKQTKELRLWRTIAEQINENLENYLFLEAKKHQKNKNLGKEPTYKFDNGVILGF